jgi:hypothetical protein
MYRMALGRSYIIILVLGLLLILISGCGDSPLELPTLAATAASPKVIAQQSIKEPTIQPASFEVGFVDDAGAEDTEVEDGDPMVTVDGLPVTWTPVPQITPPTPTRAIVVSPSRPTETPLPIPTNTPVTPSPTPSLTPSPAPPTPTPTVGADIKPLEEYALEEVIPIEAFPRPVADNGWGIHWVPTVKQDPGVVDHFVTEAARMHIKWVVFLNDGSNIGDNDYLVDKLVEAGIMPVMRIFRSNVLPYDGNIQAMVAHYRAKGVYYYQLYNEPNVNAENDQGFANANQYALTWASAARDVIEGGGLPGIGALSPGGAFDHYTFLDRTIQALRRNGDIWLLNRSWLSVHNYQGLRSLADEEGFLLFRNYNEIIRKHLNRSIPMIGTEGGSYSDNPLVEKDYITFQYTYMRQAEPYFLAYSHWVIANQVAGSWDSSWEWQALFRDNWVHPAVTDFFYKNRE